MTAAARHRTQRPGAFRRPRTASPFSAPTARLWRTIGAGTALALVSMSVAGGAHADPQAPSQQQVEASQAAVNSTAAQVAALEQQILTGQDDLENAQVAAETATEDYNEAEQNLATATVAATQAAATAGTAEAARAQSQDEIGALAAATYRNGGALSGGLEAFLSSGGPQDLIDRADAVALLSQRQQHAFAEADQTANAARQATRTAQSAEQARAAAATTAATAKRRAETAVNQAAAELATNQQRRNELISQLAVLNRTTETLQRQRQDALEADRAAAQEAAARAAIDKRERAQQVALDRAAANQAAAEKAAEEKAEAERVAAEKAAAAAEAAAQAAQAQAAAERAAERAAAGPKDDQGGQIVSAAQEAAAAAAKAAADKAAADKAAADKAAADKAAADKAAADKAAAEKAAADKAAAVKAAADKANQDKADPAPSDPGATDGDTDGTASAGRAAVAWARTQIGKPYGWGATGPNSYDCSGLTGAAWRKAGVNLPRTSRDQYRAVKKISYSQLRPGDLIFYGSGTTASSVHHVAIYSGNGKMIEAPRTGLNVREVSLRMKGAMDYAGRP